MTTPTSVHDVVIVGAGLFGAAIARECVVRDLDVALVDKDEVAGAASAIGKVALGEGLTVFGVATDLAAVARLAPHLVVEIPLEGGGGASVLDVTRLTQLYVLDAVDRGATLLVGAEVIGSGEVTLEGPPGGPGPAADEARRVAGRRVHLADGRTLDARTVVVATGAECPQIDGISPAPIRTIRTIDVAVLPTTAGRVLDELLLFPIGTAVRVVVPSADVGAAQGALARLGLEGAPVLTSEVHTVSVPEGGRRDGAPGVVHVTESAPGAHLGVATYLAEAFVHSAGHQPLEAARSTPFLRVSLGPLASSEPSADLAREWGISELSLRRLFARHGADALAVLARTQAEPRERSVLCACEAVLECEVRHALRAQGARSVSDLARRTDVARGACGGLRCAHRAAEVARAELGPDAGPAREVGRAVIEGHFRGRRPFLRAEDLGREELLLARQVIAGVVDIDESGQS